MTDSLDISDARKQLNTLDRQLDEHPVIYIKRRNKVAFAVINIEHLEAMMDTLDILADPRSLELLKKSAMNIHRSRLHTHEDVKRELL